MKEVIAYRQKGQFAIIFVVSFISMALCVAMCFLVPKLKLFYTVCAPVWGLIALMGGIGLLFPKWVIAKTGDDLLIHNGYRSFKSIKIALSNVVDVKVKDVSPKSKTKTGSMVLTYKADGYVVCDMIVIHIKSVCEVVDKIKLLVQEN